MLLLTEQQENLLAILGGVAVFVVLGLFGFVLFRSYEWLARSRIP